MFKFSTMLPKLQYVLGRLVPTLSPKLKLVLGCLTGIIVNGLHIIESLHKAAQTPAPTWIIKLMKLWFAGADPTSGESLIIGLYGAIGFFTGLANFYWHHPFSAIILAYTVFHLLKLRREYNAYKQEPPSNDNK